MGRYHGLATEETAMTAENARTGGLDQRVGAANAALNAACVDAGLDKMTTRKIVADAPKWTGRIAAMLHNRKIPAASEQAIITACERYRELCRELMTIEAERASAKRNSPG